MSNTNIRAERYDRVSLRDLSVMDAYVDSTEEVFLRLNLLGGDSDMCYVYDINKGHSSLRNLNMHVSPLPATVIVRVQRPK